jgi:hypothetical protein
MVQAPLNSLTVGADATQDLWSLMAAATNKLILHGWEVTSDAVAATLMEVTLHRISATNSGSAVTEVKLDEDDGAITGIVLSVGTTISTSTAVLAGFQWEQLGPLGQIYTPEMRPVIEVSQGIALICNTADAFEMSGWICWEEI